MPRRKKAPIRQIKLRFPEDITERIEGEAKKTRKPLNRVIINRVWLSYQQETERSLELIAGEIDVAWARFGDALHALNHQGDLLRAADALIAEVEKLPVEVKTEAITEAVAKVQTVVKVIELSAAAMVRGMHTV